MKLSQELALIFTLLLGILSTPLVAFAPSRSFPKSKLLPSLHSQQRGDHTTTCLWSLARRDLLVGGVVLLSALQAQEAASATTVVEQPPLADLPMIRLRLPKNGFGREYVALKLKIKGEGPFDFMVDTGLTTEFITPHLQQTLGIGKNNNKKNTGSSKLRGSGAGGDTGAITELVELKGAALCWGKIGGGNGVTNELLPLPTLHAIITDFPQEHIDPAHDPVEGMLGMEMLSLFDVDFDFPAGRIRFWKQGTAAASAATKAGLVDISAVVINETGLIGIRLSTPGTTQPVLALLDCGSTFSVVNWQAAKLLGLPERQDPVYRNGPVISALGIDGRPLQLPTAKKVLTFAGDIIQDPSSSTTGFQAPPPNWKPWNAVQLAVGDLPVFSSALGDGVRPYTGPAALIGLDILAQRRVIFETGAGNTRRRRILVSPK